MARAHVVTVLASGIVTRHSPQIRKKIVKHIPALLAYNPIIDRPNGDGGYTMQEVMKYQDDNHRRLFPQKYDLQGIRIEEN